MGLTLISSHTASSDATLDITSGIDSTYNEYQFQLVNMHPATDSVWLTFQVNATDDAGGGYDTSQITSTYFRAYHYENDSATALEYQTSSDQANGTAYQRISTNAGNDNDQSVSGVLTLYDPSSTTFVKHFVARSVHPQNGDEARDMHVAGYINTTSAIDEISFRTNTGNIDAGTIKMFGVS